MPSRKIAEDYNTFAKQWYEAKKNRQINPVHDFVNIPSMHRMLPSIKEKAVLCTGCGTGEECTYLKSKGAKRVVGTDISKNMIKYARLAHKGIEFYTMPIEKQDFEAGSFDLVYASLVLHYVKDWESTLAGIRRLLKKDGIFLFSVHHPAKWGSWRKKNKDFSINVLGYMNDKKNGRVKVYGDYFSVRMIHDTWYKTVQGAELSVDYYNIPISKMINSILKAGFKILEMEEPKPIARAKKLAPSFYKTSSKIPLLLVFKLKK